MATYVYWAHYADIELIFDVDEQHYEWCQVSSDQSTYDWFDATDEFWHLGSNQMLQLLNEIGGVVFEEKDPED